MPPSRPCLTCNRLTTNGSRCPEHAHLSTGARGSTSAWRRVRAAVIARDGGACVDCAATGVRLEVHHVTPKRHGGTDDPTNLVSLCHPCHANAARRPRPL